MIRRDYIMRMVQEMVQLLSRVLFLKSREEYDQALREIHVGLRKLREEESAGKQEDAGLSLDEWIALCRKHEHVAAGLMVAIADLLAQEGELLARKGQHAAGQHSLALALGLTVEALLNGEMFVSAEALAKVDQLLEATRETAYSPPIYRRLVNYFAARGRFGKAEDVLFKWLDSGDGEARAAGEEFYEQLFKLDDAILARGNLPRAEAEEGLRELRSTRTA
jgi:tetratricopeptide (TPR) repeat protein